MEAGESSFRRSGIPPVISVDHFQQRSREHIERAYGRETPTMATASLISPTSHYNPHLPSLPSHYHSAPPIPSSAPGLIPPPESRRTSDEHDAPPRQSLPSLQEVISGNQGPYGSSGPAPPQGSMPPSQSLPSPFGSSFSSRSLSDTTIEKHSPRTIHPPTSLPRPDAFSDSARIPLASRPAPPPINPYGGPHAQVPSRMELDRREAEQRQTESRQPGSGGYAHAAQPSTPGLYPQTGRLPPGQLPLSGYPSSPRSVAPGLPSPFESSRPSAHSEEPEYGYGRPGDYKGPAERNYEGWSYTDALSTIAETSRTLFSFADAYDGVAREQQGSQPIPSRLPTEREVSAMLDNVNNLQKKLEEIRDMVMQNRINHERARAFGARKGFDDDDAAMYQDGFKQPYALTEAKKRRGRAAPPGRCHSCNRIDTPEWRRGPDGARTLCNACGLHYAKLERKRQLDKAVRKPTDDRGP